MCARCSANIDGRCRRIDASAGSSRGEVYPTGNTVYYVIVCSGEATFFSVKVAGVGTANIIRGTANFLKKVN